MYGINIKEIKIKNFRSFKDNQNVISDITNLNVFTGKNNVGKTNILRAINLFFNPDIYNKKTDMNMVKQITGGGWKHPIIEINFEDSQITPGEIENYSISMNLNNEQPYKLVGNRKDIERLSNSKKIEKYLKKKFKCIYLSTTDEEISRQAYKIVNDMILQYYKKRNRDIKKNVDEFEKRYKELTKIFKSNKDSLESEISSQFELFETNNIKIEPHLKIEQNTTISDFLLDNIKLEIDDSYSQAINSKGAGVQRASLVLLTLFLLNQIYSRSNKIILLDEPEAFLYPLLITELKKTVQDYVQNNSECQIFLTTHAREFIAEISNSMYTFYNVEQVLEEKNYSRSNKEIDINKYSVIKKFDKNVKFEVLKNYGMLDDIDDYENVIVCEGMTDKNYLIKLLENKPFRPQIRFEKYLNDEKDLDYKFIPSGAQAIIPILIYLDKISDIKRRVFVLLDGDAQGTEVCKKIDEKEYKNLTIEKFLVPGKSIEDLVYTREEFVKAVCDVSPTIKKERKFYREHILRQNEKSVIDITKDFVKDWKIEQNMLNLKYLLSRNIKTISVREDNVLLKALEKFFY